ncbi:hypothetical protein E2C01_052013 [Portunus trituberculatus]|uniref:Uncharacterized protein n=1 Tax=Portunus trituberculatus TaxID=210409 RepID=A0A5B7GDB5_PORTR|nr:hypothetical protein [Portunus trituberculatus]
MNVFWCAVLTSPTLVCCYQKSTNHLVSLAFLAVTGIVTPFLHTAPPISDVKDNFCQLMHN